MSLTWGEFKKEVDRQLAEKGSGDKIEIDFIDVDFVEDEAIEVYIASNGKLTI